MIRSLLAGVAIGCVLSPLAAAGQEVEQLLQQAAQAGQRGDHQRAVIRLSDVIAAAPKESRAWYLRGREHFCAGQIAESLFDFNKYIELEPKASNRLWERGITCYYAGEFEKGAKQFEDYQTFHDQDVENSVWRYLCVARASGVEKARQSLLPISRDPRVPMMEIYALYRGKLQPDDVLAAANAGSPLREQLNLRLFYAHLYIGLWHEAAGNTDEAKKHILEAEKHKIDHYMWDVAHIHAERLRNSISRNTDLH
jgi:lipoprotein NlpI